MKKLILISVLGAGILSSCGKRHWSAGPMQTEDRTLTDSISGIEVYGPFDVFITQSSAYEIRIEAGEKLLPYIDTRVSDNTLIIDERFNQYFKGDGMRVYVSAAYLDNIKLKGSGNVECTSLSAGNAFIELDGSGDVSIDYNSINNLVVDLEGSGDINLTGTVSNANMELQGSGDINCRNLTTSDCYVNLEGSGNAKVTVLSNLTVNLEGSGNVYYWGNPTNVSTNQTGSGNIVQM